MDQRLYDAARTGDVDALDALRNADPLILNKIFLSHSAETPLHVATLAGQTKFAKQIITLMPSFARELNRDGFAPMHVASARGDEETVMELLKLDTNCSLCFQRDNSGQIPLHYAVVRGRIPVIEKLISHCSESLQEVTALGETVLHLAVKNSQFEALKVLLGRLKGLECFETLLSTKDNKGKGRTIAELAEAMKQVQVLEALKEYQNVHTDNDASAISPDPGNDEIKELAADKQVDQHQIDISSNPKTDDKQESKEGDKKSSRPAMGELVMVAAALIATVTYQAVVTPPSTIWKEGVNLNATCIFNSPNEQDGDLQATKRDCPANLYYFFMLFNSAGFFSSLLIILIVTWVHADCKSLLLLLVPVVSLIVTYEALITALSPNEISAAVVLVAPAVSVILLFRIIIVMINRKEKIRERILKWRETIQNLRRSFIQTILKCKK